MKKFFIFALLTSLMVFLGCSKKEKTDYTYTCLVGYWEPIPDDKYSGERFHNYLHNSKSVTADAALFETLDIYTKQHPKVKIDRIKYTCRAYTDDSRDYVWMFLAIKSQGHQVDTPESHQDPQPDHKPKSKKNSYHAKYGCRAWVQTEKGSRNSMYRPSHAHTHDAAVAEMRYMYTIAYPSRVNFESNCWECDLWGLDTDGREVCKKHSKSQ
jgi:hypothetical protein